MSIIEEYPLPEIQRFVENEYGLLNGTIEQTHQGLDNSVYFINEATLSGYTGDFVLKIVETKSKKDMKRSLTLARQVPYKLSPVTYFASKETGKTVTNFGYSDKPAILSDRIAGEHLDIGNNSTLKKYAKFIAKIHGTNQFRKGNASDYADNELVHIKMYWTTAVQDGVRKHTPNRLSLYEHLTDLVLKNVPAYIENAHEHLPSYTGFTHGDLNPSNIIVTPKGKLVAIDFDGAQKKGFQLTDIFQAAGKSSIGTDIDKTKQFFNVYYNKLDISVDERQVSSLVRWLNIASLKAALSTEFYTHVIPKISPEWNIQHAGSVISSLTETMERTLEFV
jgi:Ser/Thr protein kinase RdoA (MazF antagonist)